ncbi:MAG: FeoB-associated Cys-rich membrane protein [Bacillota bacterium]|nr:FeoB-associated Cys-rich membrane protein [Bacillota bacterium]HHU30810.1 FeoB-associated Cys-rich membrane protein [Bacillota bacterium]
MLTFLQQNLATIVISLILLGIVALIVRKTVKDSCSGSLWNCRCSCSECPYTPLENKK